MANLQNPNERVAALMSQAQVFASAWALVGSRFDTGHCLDDAEDAKRELEVMIAEALAAARVQALEEAAKRMEGPDNNYGAVIRALIT